MYTVKPALTATSEQRPPVNNDRPESPAQLNLQLIFLVFWTTLQTMATFWISKCWLLYTGLTVIKYN